jgi:hypothetical protein
MCLNMREVFRLDRVCADDARQAYALARLHRPDLTLTQWTNFVRHWTPRSSQRRGVAGMKDVRGYLHALFSYRVEKRLSCDRLHVSDLIVGHLAGVAIHTAIVREIECLANATGCAHILIELGWCACRPSDSAVRDAFLSAGYDPWAAVLREVQSGAGAPRQECGLSG